MYRDTLLAKPNQTNRMGVDPKILSDLERKAKQILVGVHGSDGDALLSKSLTEIIGKANDALTPIEDSAKPKEVKVVAALKTRGKTLLLTMNSRSTADWVREMDIEMKFTDAFSISLHVRQRTYNLCHRRFDSVEEYRPVVVRQQLCDGIKPEPEDNGRYEL